MNAPRELRRGHARRQVHRSIAAASSSPASRRWCACRCCSASATSPPGSTPPASSPAIAARRSAGSTRRCGSAQKLLDAHHIVFQPGINEDLAATAVWGTQQVNLFPGAKYDGVFAHVVRQGPGRRPLAATCSSTPTTPAPRKHGGVLVRGRRRPRRASPRRCRTRATTSSRPSMIPVLTPAGVQEYLDFGLHGWAMSRYSGCWVAFKAVTDTVESSAVGRRRSATASQIVAARRTSRCRRAASTSAGPTRRWRRKRGCSDHKLYAALAFCRANRLNRIVIDSPTPRLGIVTTGKSYLDVRQALDDLGIDEQLARRDRHAALQGRHDLAARARGHAPLRRRAWRRSWSSRRSASSSSTSSRRSSTTGARTCARA